MKHLKYLKKELFEMVYQWGRVGVKTDEDCNAFTETLDEYIVAFEKEKDKEIQKEADDDLKEERKCDYQDAQAEKIID